MSSKTKVKSPPTSRIRACAVCIRDEELLILRFRDRVSGVEFFSIPGGGIEAGESPLAAAIRETREETGYEVHSIVTQPIVSSYEFLWEGNLYACTTSFFLCELNDPHQEPAQTQDAPYILEWMWRPAADALKALEFHTAIRDAVVRCLALQSARKS